MHPRQAIREAVATTCTGLTTSGSRVYTSRVYPSGDANMPGLNVTTPSDKRAEEFAANRAMQLRTLTIVIEARSKPAEGTEVQNQLDDMASEVTTAIMADPTLGGLVYWIEPQDTEIELTGKIERPAGIARMTFEAQYLMDWS